MLITRTVQWVSCSASAKALADAVVTACPDLSGVSANATITTKGYSSKQQIILRADSNG